MHITILGVFLVEVAYEEQEEYNSVRSSIFITKNSLKQYMQETKYPQFPLGNKTLVLPCQLMLTTLFFIN